MATKQNRVKRKRNQRSGPTRGRSGIRKTPNRWVIRARTETIVALNRLAFLVLLILICVAVAVTLKPQQKKLRELESELAELEAQEQSLVDEYDHKQRELQAIRYDLEFQETKARDILNYYRPGETVVRIHREQ